MRFLRTVCLGALALTAACRLLSAGSAGSGDPATRLLREASLMLLKEGNSRYVADKLQHPNLDASRRGSTATQGQEPFATVLACSDSREPVELIFDRGIGDLFVVRVAGNVAGDSELASVEYGISHLYDLEQGTVNWLGTHPAQDSLLALAAQAETDPALVGQPSGDGVETNAVPANAEKPTPAVKNDNHSPAKNRAAYQRGAAQPH